MDRLNNKLIIGPWVGELGWEFMCWQAFARTISKDYEEVHVICQSGHNILYEDFTNTFSAYNPKPAYTDCCWRAGYVSLHETEDGRVLPVHSFKYEEDTDAMIPQLLSYGKVTSPVKHVLGTPRDFGPTKSTFVQYGTLQDSLHYDVVFHGRSRLSHAAQRNWPSESWDELSSKLLDQGLSCVTVGTKEESFIPNGSIDMRDISLKETIDIFANSTVGVGPSSGPVHLMSLCGLKHIVWSCTPTDQYRYEIDWNPLNTACIYMEGYSIDIPVEQIYKTVMESIE